MALQFLPMLVLGLHTGAVADRLPKRRILLTTQTLNAAATAALAAITLGGAVRAADVYAFALLSGLIFAFDAPARQAFVSEVVPPGRLRAAIALNAAVFQATRLIGPAIASPAHRERGHRLGVRGQRRLLRRPDHRPAAAAAVRSHPGSGRPPRARSAAGRRSGTCAGARTCCGRSSWSGCSARSASTSRSC